ncbi:MAG: penicillin-insensitive murein endopeptidase [Rhodobacteraceae bacterium]|nr:penicillin-insensitive murein endopeptidase [Paracoccaceae bacterium]
MIRLAGLFLALAMTAPAALAKEPKAAALFGAVGGPSAQLSEPIGDYSRGCGAGMVALPESGPTWQAMRLSRNRNWGQPVLVNYLMDLSATAAQLGWRGLYIGDMAQPRGGPSASGHLSHQSGLDADIWYLPPARLDLSVEAREEISANSVRTEDQLRVNENWTEAHHQLLKAAASDPRVDRIFVAAAIKIEMCKTARAGDKTWLQKIRPLYGHNDHFHVRLKCPAGASACVTQKPSVAELSNGGNGCDETLTWWVTDYLEELKHPLKDKGPKKRGPRDYVMADLPKACMGVLQSD